MIRDPDWFTEEANALLEEWYAKDTDEDFLEYREKHSTRRFRRYLHKQIAYRRKKRAEGIYA